MSNSHLYQPLAIDRSSASTHTEKADLLNRNFSECFNHSQPPLTDYYQVFVPESCSHDLVCTKGEVYELPSCIDTTKSNGPHGITARMLKFASSSIMPAYFQVVQSLNLVGEAS